MITCRWPFRKRLSLQQRRSVSGLVFTLPLTVGFLLFFLYPFILSVIFSLNELKIVQGGYELRFVGLANYRHALLVDAEYTRVLLTTITQTVRDVPLILAFSFFMAMLLNQKFRGRMIARVIFFLPVILSAGVVLRIERMDYMTRMLDAGLQSGSSLLSDGTLEAFLMNLKLPEAMMQYILNAVDYIPEIVKSSGIQILIFLAGLQSIPRSLYEAADVEGATGWESFWMITFPLMSPLVLTNVVYTVIDSFTASDNQVLQTVRNTAFRGAGYSVGTAMAWVYFAAIGLILAVTIGVISKSVFYRD